MAALFQIVASVVFRELQTFGVLLDIYRRVPAIYANFYGYDDVAHQLGVFDRETALYCAASTVESARSTPAGGASPIVVITIYSCFPTTA